MDGEQAPSRKKGTSYEHREKRPVAIAAAALLAAVMALGATLAGTEEAEAAFPGKNGKIAFASNRTTGEGVNNPEGDFEIFTINRDGTGLRQLTHNAALDFDPEWSPNGKRITFTSDRDLFSNVFVMNADGTKQTRVTDGRSFDRSPTFSPDGKRIAFDSNLDAGKGVDNPEGEFEIFTVRVDGTGLTQLTSNGEADFQPDWSPDGEEIAFVSRRDFRPGIYTMKADGTKQRKVSRGPAVVFQSPSYAPDGERIAFHTNQDGNFEIYKMRADGRHAVNLTNDPAGDFTPDWQPLKQRGETGQSSRMTRRPKSKNREPRRIGYLTRRTRRLHNTRDAASAATVGAEIRAREE